jgi:hypothetical protein
MIHCENNDVINAKLIFEQTANYYISIHAQSSPLLNNIVVTYSVINQAVWNINYTVGFAGNYYINVHDVAGSNKCIKY